MKEIKKKVVIAYEYAGKKKSEEIIEKDCETILNILASYINDESYKVTLLSNVENIEVENQKDLENDDEYIDSLLSGGKWGK